MFNVKKKKKDKMKDKITDEIIKIHQEYEFDDLNYYYSYISRDYIFTVTIGEIKKCFKINPVGKEVNEFFRELHTEMKYRCQKNN